MTDFIGGEVTLYHAPVWSKLLNGIIHERRHQSG